jgi:hypothetical protein
MEKKAEVNPVWETTIQKVLEDILNNSYNLTVEDLEFLRKLADKKTYE